MRLWDAGSKRADGPPALRASRQLGWWSAAVLIGLSVLILVPVIASAYLSTAPTAERNWYWQSPLPQGNDLKATAWADSNTGWAIGVGGILIKSIDGGKTWAAQDAVTTKDLSGVSFVNSSTGWIVGLSGTVEKTVDGGATWTAQTALTTPAARNLRGVSFFDANIGVAVGDQGASTSTIVYTSNGGTTWHQAVGTTSTVGLSDVEMISATEGWAVGGSGTLLKTSDGGVTWVVRPSPTSAGLSAVSFDTSGDNGYIVGNAALPDWTIYKTADRGATWSAPVGTLGLTGAINLFSVDCLDADNAVAVGSNGQIRRTRDGGATWLNQSQNIIGALGLRDVTLIDQNDAKAVGDDGTVFYTRSGGDKWFTTMPGQGGVLRTVCFKDPDNGWAAGANGAIMRTTDAGQSWSVQAAGITNWRGIHVLAPTQGWVVGDSGLIMHTSDGDNWVYQTSGTTVQLNGVWFTSTTTGFAVGNGGTILKTTNGGITWVPKPSGITQDINAVWFADATTGYAVGGSGRIRKTVDGGETWSSSISGTDQILSSIWGVDANTVWAAGARGTLVKTTDGGATWSTQNSGLSAQTILSVFFTSSSTGWLGSVNGIVRKTTDGGATWTDQDAALPTSTADPSVAVNAMWFLDSNTGYLAGDTGILRRTVNGGTDWASVQYGTLDSLQAITFTDARNGWIVGRSGMVLNTSDGGQRWSVQKPGATIGYYGIAMTDALSGWAVGDNGGIRRTTDGGKNWVAQTSGTTVNLKTVSAGDATHAIASGTGVIKYTTDAGANWLTGSPPTTQPMNSVSMIDANNAWGVSTRITGSNVVWHSVNGGATWSSQATTANANLWVVSMEDSRTGFAAGDSGIILKTTDGGANWVRKNTPTTLPFNAIGFSDASHGWAVGGGGVIVRTINGGETWALQSSGTVSRALTGIAFVDSGRGWIVGNNGTILRSTDLVPPITTLAVSPSAPGPSGWYASVAPTVTLTSNEPGTTYYGWNSAAGPFSAYTVPFAVPEGLRTLYYYSVDASANVESVKQASFKVDTTAPTAASNATVTAVATSTASLAWTASTDTISGIDHYNVYLGGLYWTSSTTTSVALVGLNASTFYSARIVAVDVAGNAAPASSPASFLTNAETTTPFVTVLGVTPLSPNGANDWYVTTPTVTMASLPMPGGTTYYSWGSSAGPYTAYTTTITPAAGVTTLFYSTHDLSMGRADEPTRQATFKLDTETPPTPSVTASVTSATSINLSWPALAQPPSGIAYYEIYMDGSRTGTATASPFDAIGLTPHTTYSFRVAAVSSAGATSSLSATVSTTTPYAALPAAPGIVYAKAPTGGYAYVNWQNSTDTQGAISYRVWRSLDGTTYSAIATTTAGLLDCSFIDRGLRSSTRYWYAVSTLDARGESALSSTATAVWPSIAPTTGPAEPPVDLTALGLNSTVALSWRASPNPAVVAYYVLRAPSSLASTSTTITSLPVTGTAYFDITAVNGEPYYYKVVPLDAYGGLGTPSLEKLGRAAQPLIGELTPHSYGDDTSACICHSAHISTADKTLIRPDGFTADTVCDACHPPATALGEYLDPLAKSKHSLAATVSPQDPFTCNTCHVPLYAKGTISANLMRVNGSSPCVAVTDTPAGDGFCYSCHGVGSTLPEGDLTEFEVSGHSNVNPPASGSGIKCDACHESHSSRNESLNTYSGYMMCMQCHTSSTINPAEPDILSRLTLNPDANAKHPLLPQDQTTGARMQCQNCHNTHTTTAQYPLVDPHDPSPAGTWITPRTDEKAFCFRCHNGLALPTSVETTPWANAVLAESSATTVTDIQGAYAINVHGYGAQSGPTTTTAFLRPDMGYSYGTVLECRACHDPHGTVNNYALRQDVVSASGDKTINGVVVAKVPGGGYDFRFFCNTCHLFDSATHDVASMADTSTVTFPMNCMACHRHVTTGGTPTRRL